MFKDKESVILDKNSAVGVTHKNNIEEHVFRDFYVLRDISEVIKTFDCRIHFRKDGRTIAAVEENNLRKAVDILCALGKSPCQKLEHFILYVTAAHDVDVCYKNQLMPGDLTFDAASSHNTEIYYKEESPVVIAAGDAAVVVAPVYGISREQDR